MSNQSDDAPTFVFYAYHPSLAAAVIFILIFLVSACHHIFLLARQRTWYFIPFLIGCFFEVVGYAGRAKSSKEYPDFTLGPYIIQSLLILLGPTLFAASIYMILGRLVVLLDADNHSLIRPQWLTKVFVLGDFLSFAMQGAGGGMLTQAKTASDMKRGENIIVGGLFVQILFFSFFMVVTVIFHIRINSRPTTRSSTLPGPWKQLLFVLYFASALVLIRSIYRVIEYITGSTGELQSKEFYLYIFDATPMALVAIVFNVFHPSRVINREIQAHMSATSRMELLSQDDLEAHRAGYGQRYMPHIAQPVKQNYAQY